ncbi:MAG: SpoIIE family protein phosphatase [Spirochaetes bacterium]|nr:SpoIIE family protein phosphatase [Spirochaetota bacterium]
MNEIIYFIKAFLPLFALVITILEQKRKYDKINNFIILLFSFILIKEISSYIILLKSSGFSEYTEKYLFLHYAFYGVYIFAFTYFVLKLIPRSKKLAFYYLIFWIIFITGLSLRTSLGFGFNLTMEFIIIGILLVSIALTMIKLAMTYFGEDEQNIIGRSKFLVNTSFVIIMFILIFIPRSISWFRNLLEIGVYSLLTILAYKHVQDGYKELVLKIKDLEYEQDILIELLSRVGSSLTAESNFDEVLKTITDYSVEVLNTRSAAILTIASNKKHLVVRYVNGLYPPVEKIEGYAATKEKFLIERFKAEKIPVGETYLGKVAASGKPLLIQDAMNDPQIIQSAKGMMDIRTVIAVPLKFQDEVVGVMSFLNKGAGGSFSLAEFNLAQTLSEQAAVTLNNFRLYNELLAKQREEREIEIAGQIQKQLLPKEPPKLEDVEIFGFSKAAKGVGGDYFDYLNFGSKRLGVIMADVAGKGVPAALIMVMIRSILRAVAKYNLEPAKVIKFLNRMIASEVAQDRYATMFYYLLDIPSKKLYFTNAAHGPMLLFKNKKKSFDLLDTEGLPVGINADQDYTMGQTTMDHGDIAMLYTDGITEARNDKKEEFTLARVKELVKANAQKSATEIGKEILNKVKNFVGEAPQHDDQTMVILKLK